MIGRMPILIFSAFGILAFSTGPSFAQKGSPSVEELERKIADLETRLDKFHEQMSVDVLNVKRLNVVDEDGTVRIALHNKDMMPGKGRKGGASAGMLFFAQDSTEVGGLLIDNKTQNLTFDQFHSDQVVGLVNWDILKGLYVWDRPQGSLQDVIKEFQKQHGRPPTVSELQFTRLFAGRGPNGEAMLALSDSKGRTRIRMIVGANGLPRIELLNAEGEIIKRLADDTASSVKLPSLDGIPTDLGGMTVAQFLGAFDYNFDEAMQALARRQKKIDAKVYEAWRNWLSQAKQMNGSASN